MHCPYQTTKNESNKADNLHRDTQKCKLRLSGTLPCPTLPADRRGKRLVALDWNIRSGYYLC